MANFGIICLQGTGHLNTVLPLGCELKRRGHNITVFMLTKESYKQNALKLQEAIHNAGGVSCAVDIIEKVVSI